MAGHGEKLSRKRELAIAHLLTASSIAEAAQQTGIGEQTLLRWLKNDSFQAAYRDARRAVVQQAITQVQRVCSDAVTTLQAVMADTAAPASARVSAAKAVLETAVKAVALEDLDARIGALEQQRQHT